MIRRTIVAGLVILSAIAFSFGCSKGSDQAKSEGEASNMQTQDGNIGNLSAGAQCAKDSDCAAGLLCTEEKCVAPKSDDKPQPVAPVISKLTCPAATSPSPSGEIVFGSDKDAEGAVLFCSLNDGAFEQCKSPFTYTNLKNGQHKFKTYAQGADGVIGDAKTCEWKVNSTTSINVTCPPPATKDTTFDLKLASDKEGAVFTCSLSKDGQNVPNECTLSDLTDGNYLLTAFAKDKLGNESETKTCLWTVKTVGPAVNIQCPNNLLGSDTVSVPFIVSEADATTVCKLDGVDMPCNGSPFSHTLTDPVDGPHSLMITAADPLGNTTSSVICQWTVDTTPPTAVNFETNIEWRGFNFYVSSHQQEMDVNFKNLEYTYIYGDKECSDDKSFLMAPRAANIVSNNPNIFFSTTQGTPIYNGIPYKLCVRAVDKVKLKGPWTASTAPVIPNSNWHTFTVDAAADYASTFPSVGGVVLVNDLYLIYGKESGKNPYNNTTRYTPTLAKVNLLDNSSELNELSVDTWQLSHPLNYYTDISAAKTRDASIHFVYDAFQINADNSSSYAVKHLWLDAGSNWHSEDINYSNSTCRYPAVASQENKLWVICQNNKFLFVRYGVQTNVPSYAWSPPIILNDSLQPTTFTRTSIAVDTNATPNRIYVTYDDIQNETLKLAYCDKDDCAVAGNWTTVIVDKPGGDYSDGIGRWNKVLVDSKGCLHIIYHTSEKNNTLYKTTRNGDTCKSLVDLETSARRLVYYEGKSNGPQDSVLDKNGIINVVSYGGSNPYSFNYTPIYPDYNKSKYQPGLFTNTPTSGNIVTESPFVFIGPDDIIYFCYSAVNGEKGIFCAFDRPIAE